MPRQREWFRVKLDTLLGFIALLEVQGRQQEANGVRLVMKWSRYTVDEAAINRHKAKLTNYSKDE